MAVIDVALAAFLEGPSAQNLATADIDGDPTVGHAWGVRVDRDRVRAIVGADTAAAMSVNVGHRIALLIVDLSTYQSVQLKGTVANVAPSSAADQDVYAVYMQEFKAALLAEDRTTPFDDALPESIVAVTIDVDAVFDQTPGPDAGRSLAELVVTVTLRELARSLEGLIPPVLATCSASGEPNLTYLSSVLVLDDDHVVVSNQFFGKTVTNLDENPRARACSSRTPTMGACTASGCASPGGRPTGRRSTTSRRESKRSRR